MLFTRKSQAMPAPEDTLPGRPGAMPITESHVVLGTPIEPPFPEGIEAAIFGMGCFWGAERLFWQLPGVYTTAVGYSGGTTPTRATRRPAPAAPVTRRPSSSPTTRAHLLRGSPADLLGGSRPDPGHATGNDVGSQYRSALYWTTPAQQEAALASKARDAIALAQSGFGTITTELAAAGEFYYAETYHQQYLARNPRGYCGIGGTGVACPIGTGVAG